MRRDDRDQPRRPGWRRPWIVAVLAVLAGLAIVDAGAATQGSANAAAAQTNFSPLALTATQSAVPDTIITQGVSHVGHLVSTHRPAVTTTVLSLLMAPLLLAGRRSANSHAVTPRRYRTCPPRHRGPPAFLTC